MSCIIRRCTSMVRRYGILRTRYDVINNTGHIVLRYRLSQQVHNITNQLGSLLEKTAWDDNLSPTCTCYSLSASCPCQSIIRQRRQLEGQKHYQQPFPHSGASSFSCYGEVYGIQPSLHSIVFALRMCYGEVYGTLHMKKMADLVTVSLQCF